MSDAHAHPRCKPLARCILSSGHPLSDEQWAILKPLLPARLPDGRPREANLRGVVNAIFYKLKHAVAWADLPRGLPAAGTVYDYYAA